MPDFSDPFNPIAFDAVYAVFLPHGTSGTSAMPRKARDERLDSRAARLRLTPRREPYWRNIQEGRAVGYRRLRGGKAGTWIARHYQAGEGRQYKALGAADDMLDADGGLTLNFAQAQEKAREWFAEIERKAGHAVESLSVGQAMDDYIEDYTARGGKALADLRITIGAHILPALGDKLVSDLVFATLRKWHHKLAEAPARLRTKATAAKANVRHADTADAKRARRATANRVLTVLKAALSLAYREGRVHADDAWRRVKPFHKVDAPRVRYLTDPEAQRLVNACPTDLRKLVTAALLTGCRYGELVALRAGDLDTGASVLHIRETKAGMPRSVPLTDDAVHFFAAETAGKTRTALVLTRDEGGAWGKSHQHRPIWDACTIAKIAPAVSFHILRHTFAARLAMRNVPMAVVAAALGNTEAICARHYAHLAPGYIANAIRENAGGMGLVPPTNIAPLSR
jgi:integrase